MGARLDASNRDSGKNLIFASCWQFWPRYCVSKRHGWLMPAFGISERICYFGRDGAPARVLRQRRNLRCIRPRRTCRFHG